MGALLIPGRSHMALDQPELLIDAARDFGKHVGGIRIATGCRLTDALSRRLAKRGQGPGNGKCVLMLVGHAESIRHKEGALRRNLNCAVCGSAEPGGTLGSEVGMILAFNRDLVEQLIDRDDTWSAHVPMRLFNFCAQIDRRG